MRYRSIKTVAGLLALLFGSSVLTYAQGRFGQWVHTSWTEQQGAPSLILSLAKSKDGYLWVGSGDGLFRFDGVSFEKVRFLSNKGRPVSSLVYGLFTAKNGDIWMATADAVGLIHHAQVHLLEPQGGTYPTHARCFAEDDQGQIWITSWNGLFRWRLGHLEQLGSDQGLPLAAFYSVYAKRDGTILAAAENGIYALKPGQAKFQRIGGPVRILNQMFEDPTGRVWLTDVEVHPLIAPRSTDPMGRSSVKVLSYRALFDPDGKLWVTTMDNGLWRIDKPLTPFGSVVDSSDRVTHFTAADGLTDNSVDSILEDESGAIWMGSRHGLDCFRKSPVVVTPFKMGYTDVEVRPGSSGDIWIGEDLRLTHATLAQQQISLKSLQLSPSDFDKPARPIAPSAPEFCTAFYSGVLCSYGSQIKAIRNPTTLGTSGITGRVSMDHNRVLWLITSGTGVFSYSDGAWKNVPIEAPKIIQPMSTAYTGRSGTTWFSFSSRLMMMKSGAVHDAPFADQIHVGTIQSIIDNGNHVWFGGTRGLAYLDRGRVGEIIPEDSDALTDIREMRETRHGSLWVSTGHGIIYIGATALQHAVSDSSFKVPYQLLGVREGFIGHSLYSEEIATDGSLWLVSHENIIRIDVSQIETQDKSPSTSIRSLEANGELVPLSETVNLPPHSTNLKFRFTGINLADPGHVTYRYMLTNVDREWQRNGAEREVMYSNLAPGKYEFHVLARNNAGPWSPDNAVVHIVIAPAWYQRQTTRICAVISVLLAGWLLFRSRIRQAELAVAKSSDARLAERMRIAADLHDTFLQTVQASKMVADDALEIESGETRLHSSMQKLSVWLGQAVAEGRAALYSLKTPAKGCGHLEEVLRQTLTQHCQERPLAISFVVDGRKRDLHPIMQDDIARIAEEAIRNACTHSRGSEVSIELRYARDLFITIKDNGIGIEAEVLKSGKMGHLGLQNMKERSAHIRGSLIVTSSLQSGTEITLRIPGTLVYRRENLPVIKRVRCFKFWEKRP